MKLTLCPHFVAHVKSLDTMNRVTVVCSECGPKSWTALVGAQDDPWQDPGWLSYAEHVRKELIPMVEDSAVCLSLVPEEDWKVDVKMATEMGYMMLLDKPIIAIVTPGTRVPNKLALVADDIVEGLPGDPGFEDRFHTAMSRVTKRLNLKGDKDGNQDQ